ncbi:unnamed protein product [Calicophoron daubneyi]|uniref:Hairy/enhancer-of-split related with YRPW motif protein n=1 Tax=Calicophoron daubneyi TaxID=300641 RepID=A0AAV2TXT8_CALDB
MAPEVDSPASRPVSLQKIPEEIPLRRPHRSWIMLYEEMSKTRMNSVDNSSEDCVGDEVGSPYASASGADRKRRRGVIEKRRRDRINCSLYDLKRLVPDMTHKPGSAKLEKAEILQATVEFLRRLYKEGHILGSETRSVELRNAGYRECMLEVTRLLSTFEGINAQCEEIKRTLITHLHYYEKQREKEAKTYLANVAAVATAIATQTSTSQPDMTKLTKCAKTSAAPSLPYCTDKNEGGYSELDNQIYCDKFYGYYNQYAVQHQTLSHAHQPYQTSAPFKHSTSILPSCSTHGSPDSCQIVANPANRFMFTSPAGGVASSVRQGTSDFSQAGAEAHLYPGYANSQGPSFMPQSNGSVGPNLLQTTGLGPNESQSTSSPPFHSTPDDPELGTSPHIPSKMNSATNDSSYIDINGKHSSTELGDNLDGSQAGSGGYPALSMLAHLHSARTTPTKTENYPDNNVNMATVGCPNGHPRDALVIQQERRNRQVTATSSLLQGSFSGSQLMGECHESQNAMRTSTTPKGSGSYLKLESQEQQQCYDHVVTYQNFPTYQVPNKDYSAWSKSTESGACNWQYPFQAL